MRKVYDLCVKISEYQDNYNKTRARWRNVGSVMEDEKGGRFILLDKYFNFAQVDTQERDNILIRLFEPKNVDNNSGSSAGFNNSGSSFNNSSAGFNNSGSSAGFNNSGAGSSAGFNNSGSGSSFNNSGSGSSFNNSGSSFNNSSSSSSFNNSGSSFNNSGSSFNNSGSSSGFNNNNQPMPFEMQGNWQRSDFNSFDNLSSDSGVPF